MHDEIRTLAFRIGEAAISRPALAAEIARRSERLEHLHHLQSHFDTIRTLSSQIKASGAPQWTPQLLSNPPGVIDHLCPADWRRRWRLRRIDRWLDEPNRYARLQQLLAARERAVADRTTHYIRTIEQISIEVDRREGKQCEM